DTLSLQEIGSTFILIFGHLKHLTDCASEIKFRVSDLACSPCRSSARSAYPGSARALGRCRPTGRGSNRRNSFSHRPPLAPLLEKSRPIRRPSHVGLAIAGGSNRRRNSMASAGEAYCP